MIDPIRNQIRSIPKDPAKLAELAGYQPTMAEEYAYTLFDDESGEEIPLTVSFVINGKYEAATLVDPPEYPEVEILKVVSDETGNEVKLTDEALRDIQVAILEDGYPEADPDALRDFYNDSAADGYGDDE